MSDTIAVRGFVATEPRHLVTEGGLPITSFRLVSTRRRYNRQAASWEDGGSNWYTVSAFRRLALSAADCIAKGDPVLVSGRLSEDDTDLSAAARLLRESRESGNVRVLACSASLVNRRLDRDELSRRVDGLVGWPTAISLIRSAERSFVW